MSHQTRTIDTIKHIDRETWNRATRGPFFSYEWFEFVETACSDIFTPQYIVCYNDDRLVGVLPAFHVKTNDNPYENYLFGRLKNLMQRLFVFKRKALLCISPLASGAYVFSDNDYSETIIDHLLAAVVETARLQRKSEVVFLYVKQTESDLIKNLKKHGYTGVYLNSTGIIYNRFQNFDDYLKSLSQSRRKSVKGDLRNFRKSQLPITSSQDEAPDAALICKLIGHIERKHHLRVSFNTPEKVKACLEKMTPYSTFYSVSNADECIAVITLFEKDRIINTYAFGIELDRARKYRVYFNLLYYNTIKEMIGRKARYSNFNAMAYKVKESRGCELVQQSMYVKVLKGRFWMVPWLALLDKQYRNKFQQFYTHEHAAYSTPSKKTHNQDQLECTK